MKLLVSYAVNPQDSGIRIRDTVVTQACPFIDEIAVAGIRKLLAETEAGKPVSIIAITKLETP